MPESKRKTTTSTAVKRRYNEKTYTNFQAFLPKDLYAEINEYISRIGWSKAEFIRRSFELIKNMED